MARLGRILAAKDVPWIVALIAGMLGWTVTHIVDRLTSAPLISYRLEECAETKENGKNYTGSFIVKNLTRDVAFQNVHFQIDAGSSTTANGFREPGKNNFIFSGESFQADPESRGVDSNGNVSKSVLIYRIQEIQPGQEWRLRFNNLAVPPSLSVRMGTPPKIQEATGKGSADVVGATDRESVHAVQLVEASWITALVAHEIGVIAALAAIFTALLCVSLLFLPPLPASP